MGDTTVARIDAQDEKTILPLRDFLVSFGCSVFVNRHTTPVAEYHIVCGENDFVKKNFSVSHTDAKRRLILTNDGDEDLVEKYGPHTKIVFVDDFFFSEDLVRDVFQFFFTGRAKVLDLTKKPKKRDVQRESEEPAPSAHDDRERIREIMHAIYHDESTRHPRMKKRDRRFFWKILLLFIILPFVWYVVSLTMATAGVGLSALFLRNGNIGVLSKVNPMTRFWIRQSRFVLQLAGSPYGQERYLSLLDNLTTSISGAGTVVRSGGSLGASLMSRVGETGAISSPARDVENLRTNLFGVQNSLGIAQSELHALLISSSFPFWIPGIKRLGERGESTLSRYRQTISSLDKFFLLYPRIAGFKRKQTYLVLLQNSVELRPTGGFIGSVAVVTLEDGRMTNFEIRDVYELDGQLKGHVDPPTPIREILGQEHWYLRDSNWDPRFAQSGAKASWFFEKETGIAVDGVIALSTPFIVDLLSVTGPITLSDYNDRITSQNFYGKALFYTQSDFFPGSTQKKDFLGSLSRGVLDTLISSKTIHPVSLFRVLTKGLASRDLMVYFSDPDLTSMVRQFGWSGDVFAQQGCVGVSGSCLFTPLMVVEANLGVNKANFFVNRRLRRALSITQNGRIAEKTILALENTFSGQYRAYVRLYMAPGSSVTGIEANGTPFDISKAQFDQTNGILGIAIDVSPGEVTQLSVEHTLLDAVQFASGKATLELFTQKQAGVVDTPFSVSVDYPPFWEGKTGSTVLANDGRFEYNSSLSHDSSLRLEFQK